ncbi:MAG: terminase [Saprospiraceae bacterium]|jgi:hypothetical protein|nr:terminase [Saprospiraceae bacterium]
MINKKDQLATRLEKHLPAEKMPAPKPVIKPSDVQDDYEFSRDTLKNLIATGMNSLDALAELARESEHPRAFEVLSKSIKDIGDVTDKLMSLQKATKDLTTDKNDNSAQGNVTNNNVFLGSTTDLQRLLLDNKKIIDADPQE